VVGPRVKLHECGMPKRIALELYQPFIIRKLKERGYATTIRAAKKMLEQREEEVWDILEEVIKEHPVLLNRAPTLHRMGIQAFQPVLVEGNAIEIHPLVCHGFNADFDGDQMAVHLPLSFESQIEAKLLMMSIHNVFSPAHGGPIIVPMQDMVLGCHWLTYMYPQDKEKKLEEVKFRYSDAAEVLLAIDKNVVSYHTPIILRLSKGRKVVTEERRYTPEDSRCLTTPGRVIFNQMLPEEMPYYNYTLDKKAVSKIVAECHSQLGIKATLELLDNMKDLGFRMSTKSGLSFAVTDLRAFPDKEKIIAETEAKVAQKYKAWERGIITEGERYNQVIDHWTHATETISRGVMKELEKDTITKRRVNPIYMMVLSAARGSEQQVRQMAGLRGLMAKPSGEIIENPIRANFREGLRICEYFSSMHGARKGLADTALKTADSGYLTRRLVDVSQGVVITMQDCGTLNGITKERIVRGDKVEVSLAEAVRGRVARDTIKYPVTDEVIVQEDELITEEKAKRLEELGYNKIRVRSPLTCEAPRGICAKCYGMDLSRGELAEEGLAVGIIAAQSIGEPGTQLTMRTFHIGGAAFRPIEENEVKAKVDGTVSFENLLFATNEEGEKIVLNKSAKIKVLDEVGRAIPLEGHAVPIGARLFVSDGKAVKAGDVLAKWDPHTVPILAEREGRVAFEDIIEDETVRVQVDQTTGMVRRVVAAHKGDKHPQILIEDKEGRKLAVYPLPEKAHIEVKEGQSVKAGTMLAKMPREIRGTQDITGGLPRVVELFEARRPRDPAIMSEINGVVELGERRRGKRVIKVKDPKTGIEMEHLIPPGKHIRVQTGDYVKAGEPLIEGPLVPQDILAVSGTEEVQQYLLQEVQSVYRSQGVKTDDKHIEVIISQMMRFVKITDSGDSKFLQDEIVDKFVFREEVARLKEEKKKPPTAKEIILGITRAALISDSFISAASFQETIKVLTKAALSGQIDRLEGLKENVILGHMIPAGTGYRKYRRMRVKKEKFLEPSAVEEMSGGVAAG
ncbi:MAG: DNA-directed RNA polymerase subunit beta', partial [Planctomycetota bacterium]|nr:DNA-directed RNA polymerase subunit beta' [Planctomycetota bacterium]